MPFWRSRWVPQDAGAVVEALVELDPLSSFGVIEGSLRVVVGRDDPPFWRRICDQ
jgi:hypothetical protein